MICNLFILQRERSPERIDLQPPCIELDGNPSSFIVYAGVRQAVLEHQMRQVSTAYTAASNPWCSDSDSEEEDQDRAKDSAPKMPKVGVVLTLCGLVVPFGNTDLGRHWLR